IVPSPPPERLNIQEKLELELKSKKKSTSFIDLILPLAHADDTYAPISWEGREDAKHYIIEIYRDSALKDLILREKVERPYFEWVTAAPGTFYWRVKVIDFWARESPF